MGEWAKKLVWLVVLALNAAGCSSPGGRLALFPEGYRLSTDARSIRRATPPPAEMARELDKQTVPRGADDTPVELGNLGFDHLGAKAHKPRQRTGLVGRHQP